MRLSKSYIKTYKEAPQSADTISHNLLLRAGYIKQLTRGVYTYLPFATRVLNKIEKIVREELEKAGAQEILMSVIQPADLWIESGRYFAYGKELMRFKDRNDRDFILGPTNEEAVVSIVRDTVKSYKELPLNLFQIQIKFRDELRPRFGLMRGREFIMKDGYSFHVDTEDLDREYLLMKNAYTNIFTRLNVDFRAVEADTGSIGGDGSHEFMVIADSGEDDILFSDKGTYAANIEKAVSKLEEYVVNEDKKPLEKVHTPNTTTIELVSEFLNKDKRQTMKAVVFKEELEDKNNYYLAVIRGDLEVNDIKVKNVVNAKVELELASDEDLEKLGLVKGFIGPLKTLESKNFKIVLDESLKNIVNSVCGANEKDYHVVNVNLEDIKYDFIGDIRLARENDKSLFDDGVLKLAKGIEVGHIFKLGQKYSKAMNLKVLNKDGKEIIPTMGCYGIGISRIMPAVIEQHHDENGIIWPVPIAPYHVIIIPANIKDEKQVEISNRLYEELLNNGIEVILDDRNEKVGFKFKDSELIGIPYRITIGKDIEQGLVEFTTRSTKETVKLSLEEAKAKIYELLKK